uniref:Protein kinase domain-containing protein n=1 Tax=Cynoglossus semilaevis TaxID=244447 RepID=A0A3P8V1K1_CYNSE
MKRREREPNYKLIYTLNGYSPVNPLGTGAFGKVYKCVSVETKETVALKSVKKWTGEKEVAMLEKLRTLDKDNSNLIKFNKHFEFAGFLTLEFEMLDMDLHQFVKSFTRPLQLPEIQAITQQMLVALDALKSVRVVHTDIKPDNIMLINHQQLPFKVKLIDFGLAHTISEMHTGTKHQATLYRAPEVLLGLPLHEGLDMWSLGCVAAYLYLGQHLYPSRCEHERMRDTVQIHELPKERRNAAYQRKFFERITPCKALEHPFITSARSSIPWHLVAHYPCHAWTCVVKNSKEGDKEVARLLSVVTVLVSLSMNWNNLRP